MLLILGDKMFIRGRQGPNDRQELTITFVPYDSYRFNTVALEINLAAGEKIVYTILVPGNVGRNVLERLRTL